MGEIAHGASPESVGEVLPVFCTKKSTLPCGSCPDRPLEHLLTADYSMELACGHKTETLRVSPSCGSAPEGRPGVPGTQPTAASPQGTFGSGGRLAARTPAWKLAWPLPALICGRRIPSERMPLPLLCRCSEEATDAGGGRAWQDPGEGGGPEQGRGLEFGFHGTNTSLEKYFCAFETHACAMGLGPLPTARLTVGIHTRRGGTWKTGRDMGNGPSTRVSNFQNTIVSHRWRKRTVQARTHCLHLSLHGWALGSFTTSLEARRPLRNYHPQQGIMSVHKRLWRQAWSLRDHPP